MLTSAGMPFPQMFSQLALLPLREGSLFSPPALPTPFLILLFIKTFGNPIYYAYLFIYFPQWSSRVRRLLPAWFTIVPPEFTTVLGP
jgi:hypothetical protein